MKDNSNTIHADDTDRTDRMNEYRIMRTMRILGVMLFLLLLKDVVYAQDYDKVWVMGSPMCTMSFGPDSVSLGHLADTAYSFLTLGNICDTRGNLQFCTNGMTVYDRNGKKMPNGDSLSYPSRWYDDLGDGMSSRQGVVILPNLSDTNRYYIFHYTSTDTILPYPGGYESLNFYYSLVDMRLNNGKGDLVVKNAPLIQNELLSFSRLSACKHANGRDWWIIKNAWHENIYYEFLLTPDGIQGPFIQQIGPKFKVGGEQPGYSIFTPDGSKYISFTAQSYIVLMDFDRCTGLFSNPDSFYNNTSTDPLHTPISGGASGALSSSGRFFYINNRIELNQYDLWSPHVHDSVRIMTLADSSDFYNMDILQLAPNGKIYVSCWNGGSYKIHVINQPDSFGLACDFRMYSQPVLTPNPIALPYFPNYKLGALAGSCDTISTSISDIAAAHPAFAQVYPNPASDHTELFYYTGGNTANQAVVYDVAGKDVWCKDVKGSNGTIQIDLSGLAEGVYVVRFSADGGMVMSGKLVVAR